MYRKPPRLSPFGAAMAVVARAYVRTTPVEHAPAPTINADALAILLDAYDLARGSGNPRVTPEHVALALLWRPGAPGRALLTALDAPRWALLGVLLRLEPPAGPPLTGEPSLDPHTVAVLRVAALEADMEGARRVEVRHLRLGLTASEGEGAAAIVLGSAGRELRRRRMFETVLSSGSAECPRPGGELGRAAARARLLPPPVYRARVACRRRRASSPLAPEPAWSGFPDWLGDAARGLLRGARVEARCFRDPYIGTRHLLIAMAEQEEAIPGRLLARAGVDAPRLRQAARRICGYGDDRSPAVREPSRWVRRAVAAGREEARRLGAARVEPEHLLLGLLLGERGVACGLLDALGVRLEWLRGAVLRKIAAAGSPDA